MLNTDSILFHLHVPKSAGTLFNKVLLKNNGDLFLHENPYNSCANYSEEEVREMISFYQFSVYAGHVFNIDNTPFYKFKNLTAISFVRDPIDKFFSFYFFQRNRWETSSDSCAKTMDLDEYINWMLNIGSSKKGIDRDSGQLSWIGASGIEDDKLTNLMYSGRYLIFPSERFDEACVVLQKIFPKQLGNCSYGKRINRSKRDQEVLPEQIDLVSKFDWIDQDLLFHKLAHNKLDELIKENFVDEVEFTNALDTFKKSNKELSNTSLTFKDKVKFKLTKLIDKL